MPRHPDDILGPFDKAPDDSVIDVTPRPQEKKPAIDFSSDKPLIEQLLEKKPQGPDRTDRTLETSGCLTQAAKIFLFLFSAVSVLVLVFVFWR